MQSRYFIVRDRVAEAALNKRARFFLAECQLLQPDFSQGAACAKSMQGKPGVMTGDDHQVQVYRWSLQDGVDECIDFRRRDPVIVVQDQDKGFPDLISIIAEKGCRNPDIRKNRGLKDLGGTDEAARIGAAQCSDDIGKKLGKITFSRIQRQPGGFAFHLL